MNIKYSIIIPTYNVEKYIVSCLESIEKIRPNLSEIILVDDGSVDNTVKVIENYIKGKNNYKFFKINHLGVSKARNVALDAAEGELVCFVDSDDLLDEAYFNTIDSLMSEDLEILHFNYYSFKEKSQKNKLQLEFNGNGKDFLNSALLQDKYSTSVWSHTFRRSFFEKNIIRFIEGVYHEDEEFNIQCLLKAEKVLSTNVYLYHYRIHPTSIMQNPIYSKIRTDSKFIIFEQYINKKNLSHEQVYITLCTYLSFMLLLEIVKYPSGSQEFKELALKYKRMKAINQIQSNLILYIGLKTLYRICPSLVYSVLRRIMKQKTRID